MSYLQLLVFAPLSSRSLRLLRFTLLGGFCRADRLRRPLRECKSLLKSRSRSPCYFLSMTGLRCWLVIRSLLWPSPWCLIPGGPLGQGIPSGPATLPPLCSYRLDHREASTSKDATSKKLTSEALSLLDQKTSGYGRHFGPDGDKWRPSRRPRPKIRDSIVRLRGARLIRGGGLTKLRG